MKTKSAKRRHDLKNLLAGIKVFSELIAMEKAVKKNKKIGDYLKKIDERIEKMVRFIDSNIK